jgi:nicotinamidase/pyrazinamidase
MNGTLLFVDIDTQHDFIDADGRLSVPGADHLVETLARLTSFAEREGIPILASADAHLPGDPEFDQFPPHCLAGTDGQKKVAGTLLEAPVVVDARGGGFPVEQPLQTIVEKVTFSMFSNPAVDAYLSQFAPARAVVYGVATDYCVRQAVEGLVERGIPVTVVIDAIAGVTAEGSRLALEAFEEAGVVLTTTEEVVAGRAPA